MGSLSRSGFGVGVVSIILVAGSAAADVIREGTGTRRAQLDALELQPFPGAAWGTLSNWTGNPVDAASTNGQVVLICTWANWYPTSVSALPVAQKAAAAHAGKGLTVVGVHHFEGWDDAAKTAQAKGVTFPIALDAKGDFRKALMVDQDPDFYLIDRAGRLRYADITTASVEDAVKELVGETPEQAADLPRILAERAAKAKADAGRTGAIRQNIDLDRLPEVPFEMPPPEAYQGLDWPKLTEEQKRLLGLDDEIRKPEEVKLTVPAEAERYWPLGALEKPRPGRAIVAYVWNPDIRVTYDQMMPKMDRLQREHKRDLTVIGALTPARAIDRQSETNADEDSAEKLVRKYVSFVNERSFDHILVLDVSGVVLGSLQSRGSRAFDLPGVIIASSDNTIRWAGSINSPGYQAAIDKIIAVDPGIKARRAAENRFIQSQK